MLTLTGLHILSEYRRCIQTDNDNEVGTSAVRHVDTRGITGQCDISRASARR